MCNKKCEIISDCINENELPQLETGIDELLTELVQITEDALDEIEKICFSY